jgi:hypothetical protein
MPTPGTKTRQDAPGSTIGGQKAPPADLIDAAHAPPVPRPLSDSAGRGDLWRVGVVAGIACLALALPVRWLCGRIAARLALEVFGTWRFPRPADRRLVELAGGWWTAGDILAYVLALAGVGFLTWAWWLRSRPARPPGGPTTGYR